MSEDFTPTNPEIARKAADFVETWIDQFLKPFDIPDEATVAEVEGDEDSTEFYTAVNAILDLTRKQIKAGLEDFRRGLAAGSN